MLKKHKWGDIIKINTEGLRKVTNILLNNIEDELKNGYKLNQKIALFYTNIGDKTYYYSYNILNEEFDDLYNSYKIVDINYARKLLSKQIEC